MDKKTLGLLFVFIASFFWAIEGIFIKLSYLDSADFFQVSFFRSMFIALVGFLYVLFSNKANFSVTKKDFSKILVLAVAATIVADSFFIFALKETALLNVSVLSHLQPLFIVLFGFVVFQKDTPSKTSLIGIFLLLVAGIFVSAKTPQNLFSFQFGGFADLLVLVAAAIWAAMTIMIKKYLSHLHVGILIFYRFLSASMVFLAFFLLTGHLFFSSIFQALVGIASGFGFVFYYEGLKRLKSAEAGAMELATPFFAALLGFFVLSEQVAPLQIAAIALLFAGVYFLSKKEK